MNFSCCDEYVCLPTGIYSDSQRLLMKPQHFVELLFHTGSASRHSELTRLCIHWRRWRRGRLTVFMTDDYFGCHCMSGGIVCFSLLLIVTL